MEREEQEEEEEEGEGEGRGNGGVVRGGSGGGALCRPNRGPS